MRGLIALEIAHILESRGVKNIKLYILDTFIFDDYLLSKVNNISSRKKEKNRTSFLEAMQNEGYDPLYIHKVIANLDVEDKLMSNQIQYPLNSSILLFKAMLKDPRLEQETSIARFTTIPKHLNIIILTQSSRMWRTFAL